LRRLAGVRLEVEHCLRCAKQFVLLLGEAMFDINRVRLTDTLPCSLAGAVSLHRA
jgi:hypothetical protein